MKILHTSDWHIGKRLCGRERLDEQRAVFSEIAQICDREQIELVLVAGDVFDSYLPSAEAEDLFYDTVKMLSGGKRCVIVISGNHDDHVRLTAATALSEEQGIYLYGNNDRVPKLHAAEWIHVLETSPNHMVVENCAGERVFINILPYPNEARLKEDKKPEESFCEKMSRWISNGEVKNTRHYPSIFLSHLFVAGGQMSESEREIDLGGARAVPLGLLPPSDYIALGHLHRRQQFKGNVVYSGSIMQYAFDEAGCEKSVAVFDLGEKGVQGLRQIPLTQEKKLVRLETDSADAALELLKKYPDAYIELTIHLREPLTSEQVRLMKEINSGLVSIIPQVSGASFGVVESRKRLSSEELFVAFYKAQFAEGPSEELKQLFLSLSEEANAT